MSEILRKARGSPATRWLLGTCLAAGLAMGVMGFLHTSIGKPLLMKAGVMGGGCPVGRAPAAEVEAARRAEIQASRGADPAPRRLALGFTLGKTSLDEIRAWADRNHVACSEKREGTLLICTRVPASALEASFSRATIDEATFSFRTQDRRLISVSAWRYGLTPESASVELDAVVVGLRGSLGNPSEEVGVRRADALAASDYATAIVSYAFADYLATVSSTNLPGKGIALREQYLSALD